MTEQQEIKIRFESAKAHMIMCDDKYATIDPTDKEVWEFMLSVAKIRLQEALADDMEGFVIGWQRRIALIMEGLNSIVEGERANQQAQAHDAQLAYENASHTDWIIE